MKHTVQVGKPITKNGKIVGYEEIQTIPSNQAFNYNRRGFATLQPGDLKAVGQGDKSDEPEKEPVKQAPKKTPGKKKAAATKKAAAAKKKAAAAKKNTGK